MADPRPWVYGTDGLNVIATAGRDALFSGEGGGDVLYGGPADDFVWPLDGGLPFPAPDLARNARPAGVLAGAAGNDTLYGTGGGDFFYGGDGDDRLLGGEGGDHLNGGPGADTFVWRPLSPSEPITDTAGDFVADFQPGTDKIDLSAYQNPFFPGAVWKGTEPLIQGTQLQIGYAPGGDGGITVRFLAPYTDYAGPFPSAVPAYAMSGEFKVHIGYGGPQTLSKADFLAGAWSGSDDAAASPAPSPTAPAVPPAPSPAFASEHQAQAARLHNAALDRVPDAEGLRYWTAALDGGQALQALADGFMASPEWQARYGSFGNEEFVEALYANILDRAGEPEGVAFWTGHLDAGRSVRSATLVGFSESPENVAKVVAADFFL